MNELPDFIRTSIWLENTHHPKELDNYSINNTIQNIKNKMEVAIELPKYQSHKQVWALKIKGIAFEPDAPKDPNGKTNDSALLEFEDERYMPIKVDSEYVNKHKPQVGGYYVVYEDGYKSWSPAEAFESGYTKID